MAQSRRTSTMLLAVVCLSLFVPACHRGYYRRQADVDAARLVREKAVDPRWNSSDGCIEVDPQSRMFDPFSSDHPPIPADDASSHQLMHMVDGKEGYPHWHANGDTSFVENPEWTAYLPLNADGELEIDVDRAYQLALLHSPDLQQQNESLYLSALDVSLQRFGFDTQLFTGFNTFLTTQGRFRGGGSSQTNVATSLGANGQGLNLQKAGITGATFAVGLANSIVWNFAGPNTQSANSLVDFTIIQPLLRGAGRERIMESLTQSERTLLANVRQMDRFRRGFYLQIVTGRSAGAGVGSNFLGQPQGGGGGVGGYFGLLQQQQQIRIQEFNLRQLENVLEQFREFYLRERIDALQVRFFESSLYGAQQGLLQSKTNYQNSLDNFKQTLGLPPEIPVKILDPYLDKFEFISDEITARQNQLNRLKTLAGQDLITIGEGIPSGLDLQIEGLDIPDQDPFDWPDDLNEQLTALNEYIDSALEQIAEIRSEDVKQLESDFRKLDSVRPGRVRYLEQLRRKLAAIPPTEVNVEPQIFAADSIRTGDELREGMQKTIKNLDANEQGLKVLKQRIEDFESLRKDLSDVELTRLVKDDIIEILPAELTNLFNLVLELSLLQAQARADSIELADVDLSEQRAWQIARCMRRDLMNARAALVDQWRQIEFVADQLEAQVDFVFSGDIGNVGDNPFKIRYETGQLRGGIRFDAPIVRMAERNNYRQTLIRYQQSKRNFYRFEDEVKRNLRQTLRTVDLNQILFEISRKSVKLNIERVEVSRLRLDEPSGVGATRSTLGATTAQDLTNSINGLQGAQSQFLSIWVNFEVLRRNLDFDLGTMQLDDYGAWLDPGTIDQAIGYRAASRMGIELDCQFCSGVDVMIDDDMSQQLDDEFEAFDTRPPQSPRESTSERRGNDSSSERLPTQEDYFRDVTEPPRALDLDNNVNPNLEPPRPDFEPGEPLLEGSEPRSIDLDDLNGQGTSSSETEQWKAQFAELQSRIAGLESDLTVARLSGETKQAETSPAKNSVAGVGLAANGETGAERTDVRETAAEQATPSLARAGLPSHDSSNSATSADAPAEPSRVASVPDLLQPNSIQTPVAMETVVTEGVERIGRNDESNDGVRQAVQISAIEAAPISVIMTGFESGLETIDKPLQGSPIAPAEWLEPAIQSLEQETTAPADSVLAPWRLPLSGFNSRLSIPHPSGSDPLLAIQAARLARDSQRGSMPLPDEVGEPKNSDLNPAQNVSEPGVVVATIRAESRPGTARIVSEGRISPIAPAAAKSKESEPEMPSFEPPAWWGR